MAGRVQQTCQVCSSNIGFNRSDDGFFYCGYCNSQAEDIVETGVDEEQFFNHYSASCNRVRPANVIVAEPISQVKPTTSQYLDHPDIMVDDMENTMGDEDGPTEPSDFASRQKSFSYEEYYSEIRSRYLMGLQIMIQLQCRTLVEKFNMSPIIVGLVGPVWLRYLASTRIMADEWADRAVDDSEAQTQGEAEEVGPSDQYRAEPVSIHGKRVVYIWYRSLSSTIPLSCSLAISFLACHVAREAILPSDILKWTLEGELPYFAAFSEIEKQLGPRSEACPISDSRMFRPLRTISSQKLESMAAEIAKNIGLDLPPVNFYAIASRYCTQLSLPTQEIIPLACCVSEWSKPSELYLSANELRIPTRACVMSILIVAIRIRFNINGYGMWESSLSDHSCSKSHVKENEESEFEIHLPFKNTEAGGAEVDVEDSRMSFIELLHILEERYNELDDVHAYSNDLLSYLQYCKDVVFSGLWPTYEDLEEEKLMTEFWDFYQKNKDPGTCKKRSRYGKRSRREEAKETMGNESTCNTSQSHDLDSDNRSRPSNESYKDRAIRKLKLDMEENKFCYIPPRVKVKRKDYLHYARRRKDVYIYAVHADYYVLLRSCAKVAQVETRIMHVAVLSLERRLHWLEKRIEYSLNLEPNINDVCDYCKDEFVQTAGGERMDLNA